MSSYQVTFVAPDWKLPLPAHLLELWLEQAAQRVPVHPRFRIVLWLVRSQVSGQSIGSGKGKGHKVQKSTQSQLQSTKSPLCRRDGFGPGPKPAARGSDRFFGKPDPARARH